MTKPLHDHTLLVARRRPLQWSLELRALMKTPLLIVESPNQSQVIDEKKIVNKHDNMMCVSRTVQQGSSVSLRSGELERGGSANSQGSVVLMFSTRSPGTAA